MEPARPHAPCAATAAALALAAASVVFAPAVARADDGPATAPTTSAPPAAPPTAPATNPTATEPEPATNGPYTPGGSTMRMHHPVNVRATRYFRPQWRRVNFVEYTGAGLSLATLAFEALYFQPRRPDNHWVQPILFDEDVRNALRIQNNPGLTQSVSDWSWGLMIGLIAYPVAVDVPIAGLRGGGDLAWQLFWQDALALSMATAVDLFVRDVTGRARPYYWDCLSHGGACTEQLEDNRSFPGGHMAVSSAGAALICTQHLATHLYGGPLDVAVCGAAVAADVAVGAMRIMLDVHWASDIMVGMALGTLIGWSTPQLMNYMQHHSRPPGTPTGVTASTGTMVAPMFMPTPGGGALGMIGMF